jgi:hypothetical protein
MMLKVYETPEDEPVPPECRVTVDRIQNALDGNGDALDADPHATACAACRERVRAARVLLSVLAIPGEPVAVPAGFANRVVEAMKTERYARIRRRSYVGTVGALAAAVLLAVGLAWYFENPHQPVVFTKPAVTPLERAETAPTPREKDPGKTPEPAPEPRPIRFGDAVANTGQAILDTPKPFADSMAVAPKVLDVLTSPFKLPAPPADPMGVALEPARKSLAEIPIAAREGLQPVTGTAEKALARFLRDMGSVKPNS